MSKITKKDPLWKVIVAEIDARKYTLSQEPLLQILNQEKDRVERFMNTYRWLKENETYGALVMIHMEKRDLWFHVGLPYATNHMIPSPLSIKSFLLKQGYDPSTAERFESVRTGNEMKGVFMERPSIQDLSTIIGTHILVTSSKGGNHHDSQIYSP
ncbi:MAG: hypothetical protein V1866_00905 [archaeon]